MCLSVCLFPGGRVPVWPLSMMHWISPYRDPLDCSNLFNLDLTVQPPDPAPQGTGTHPHPPTPTVDKLVVRILMECFLVRYGNNGNLRQNCRIAISSGVSLGVKQTMAFLHTNANVTHCPKIRTSTTIWCYRLVIYGLRVWAGPFKVTSLPFDATSDTADIWVNLMIT